jgi:very-short-patch-repair endonuclease
LCYGRIAIELDGKNHFTEDGMKYDEVRTRYLNSLNIKVVRFENVRVFQELDKVLEEIKAALYHPDRGLRPAVCPS